MPSPRGLTVKLYLLIMSDYPTENSFKVPLLDGLFFDILWQMNS